MKSKLKNGMLVLCGMLYLPLAQAQSDTSEMRGLSSLEIAAEMAPGLNLWNTLDAWCNWCADPSAGLESENTWGQPTTTPEMVATMAERGFKTLRIPVTWFNHLGPYPEYAIDSVWLDRVEEVANYALDQGMYAIINIHHDDYKEGNEGTWLCPTYEKQDTVTDQLVKIWTQIATRFRDYGDYLVFETMNEPREVGSSTEWTGGSAEHREVINAFNLAALDAIRATGGNNETRFIMLPQVGANIGAAIDAMAIPHADTNTLVSVHGYSPYWFCQADDGTDKWGSSSEVSALRNMLQSLVEPFVDKGIGVIVGEWGAKDKDNYYQRINYYTKYADFCKEAGVTPIPWMYSLDRKNLTWTQPLIEEGILQAYDTAWVAVDSLVLNHVSDTLFVGDTLRLAAAIYPDTASTKDLAWTCSDRYVASVDASGLVTAKGQGLAKVSATTIETSVYCLVLVLDTVTHLDFHMEAEDYVGMSGIQTESSSDIGGGQNVGWIDNGDWCDYSLMVDSAGTYDVCARVATANNGGSIEFKAGIWTVGTLKVDGSKSNGWQDWYTTDTVQMELEKGIQTLRLNFKGNGSGLFNVNWFELRHRAPEENTFAQDELQKDRGIHVYPNPATDQAFVQFTAHQDGMASLKVLDTGGRVHHSLSIPCTAGTVHKERIRFQSIPAGICFVILEINHTFRGAEKIIFQNEN